MLNYVEVWGLWWPDEMLNFIRMFLVPFFNNSSCMDWGIIILKDGVPLQKQCLNHRMISVAQNS